MRGAVEREVAILAERDTSVNSSASQPTNSQPSTSRNSGLKRKSLDAFARPVVKKNAGRSVASEIDDYYNDQAEKDCIKFWAKAGSDYPFLKRVVDHVMSVPATEAESERVFSSSGLIMSPLRSRMSAKHLSLIIFLHGNVEFVPEPKLKSGS